MLRILYTFAFCFLIFTESYSQKSLEKKWDASAISAIEINSDAVFNVKITSMESSENIILKTQIDGETYEFVLISTSINKKKLKISTGYSPFFSFKNDKLAAHKLISIEMELIVPESMDIAVFSSLASVNAIGNFNMLRTELYNGNCLLEDFSGNAILQTRLGTISAFCEPNVAGIANSKDGKIINKLPKRAKYTVNAESIHGAIILNQIE